MPPLSTRHHTSPPTTNTTPHRRKRSGDETRRGRATRDRETTRRTPHPPFNGDNTQTEGGHHTQDGEANNTAALHSPCHPPSTMPPHHPQRPHPPPRRGGSRQRIPHHTNSTDTHSPPTHHTPSNGTVHDMTAVLASTAMGRVRHEPHHCTRQNSSSTHHRHSTHRGGWTPSTHPHCLLSLIHVHTTNEQQ